MQKRVHRVDLVKEYLVLVAKIGELGKKTAILHNNATKMMEIY